MARGVKGNELVRIGMRIPRSLRDWMQEEAERANRSMTDILVMALERMKGEKV